MFELLTSISKIGPKVGLEYYHCFAKANRSIYLSEDIGKLSAPGVIRNSRKNSSRT